MAFFHRSVEAFAFLSRWQQPQARRWLLLSIALAALLIIGFYTVTDSSRLANNHILDGADWTGYAICHRITARSFSINGRQLPLCARCTGMYLGIVLVFLVLMLSGRLRCSELPPLRVLLVLAAFVGLMGIDGLNSYAHFFPDAPHLYQPRNWLRLITGMGTGLAMGVVIFPALAQTLWRRPAWHPAINTLQELWHLVLVAAVAVLLVLSNQATLLYVLALVSGTGVLLILTAINTVLLLVLLRRDGRATRWVETAVPLSAGFLFAVVQIGAIAWLRFSLTGTMTGFPGL